MVREAKAGHGGECPPKINTTGLRAHYDNLERDEALTLTIDQTIRDTAQSGWRNNKMKERMIRRKLLEILDTEEDANKIIEIIRSHNEY